VLVQELMQGLSKRHSGGNRFILNNREGLIQLRIIFRGFSLKNHIYY